MLTSWKNVNTLSMDYIIVVAGGKGTRMGTDIPKQFLPVGGKPVLMRTLERFASAGLQLNLIVVLPREQQDYWKELCRKYAFNLQHQIADGGSTRFESSKNGLALIPDNEDGVVGFHDGVRPFVATEVIRQCYLTAHRTGSALPTSPVTSTLRQKQSNGEWLNVLRSNYREVQTPQVFSIALAKQAFNQPYREQFTDDASVIEALGQHVTMVDGNRENIKLTTPFDLVVAEALLNHENNKTL